MDFTTVQEFVSNLPEGTIRECIDELSTCVRMSYQQIGVHKKEIRRWEATLAEAGTLANETWNPERDPLRTTQAYLTICWVVLSATTKSLLSLTDDSEMRPALMRIAEEQQTAEGRKLHDLRKESLIIFEKNAIRYELLRMALHAELERRADSGACHV